MAVLGRVFLDENRDNIDNDNSGVRWVLVQLRTPEGGIVAEMRTDAAGAYRFEDVPPGEYVVRFGYPGDGLSYVQPNVGGDEAADSDAMALANGRALSEVIVVGSADDIVQVDAGAASPPDDATVEGRAFLDANGNGIDDTALGLAEAGMAHILVQLRTPEGAIIAETRTDAEGRYSFDGIAAGEYTIRFGRAGSDDFEFVDPHSAPGTDLDSEAVPNANGVAYTQEFSLDDGQALDGVNAGYQIAEGGDADGRISGRVFEDLNGNGIDDGEPGIAGIPLYLRMPEGSEQLDRMVMSDADGNYVFTGLEQGIYAVDIDYETGRTADGRHAVAANQGGDEGVDSDFYLYEIPERESHGSFGAPNIVILGSDAVQPDVDLGLSPPPDDPDLAGVTGRVFLDLNGNGLDDGEPGLAGVRVGLRRDFNARDSTTTYDVTDENGEYSLAGFEATATQGQGIEYLLLFERPGPGYAITETDVGDDDSIDSDGAAVFFTFETGETRTDQDLGYLPPPQAPSDADAFMFDL
ncbi:SdrD B-like domain-containing protein [Paracoccus tegillarcae]|uniref:SD-repeat containing protein B domain-containing protein n=1 Tax=Paracoccus tegillarcae TaxID=1529068 RepID=A0A2K9EK18_9RHOB|nr:SdrD B-like domain-containing protein [Paracoccus tegillarcae]AUH34739.1 hypothetical protein CUV01_16320 [Paracoccus tegillarcae]